jgi:hypothetical protein
MAPGKPTVVYSLGALCNMLGLQSWTLRRGLDRAAARGLLSPASRAGNGWRMVADLDVPAVVAALRELGYQVQDAPPPGTPIRDEVAETLERVGRTRSGPRPSANGNGRKDGHR